MRIEFWLASLVRWSSAGSDCASPANWVVAENCLAGVAMEEWDVNGAGSDDVVGFTSRASAVPGQSVGLKIWTAGYDASLQVDVFRFGWYSGLGARRVAKLELTEAAKVAAGSQPECARPEAELTDCGNWATVARFDVPEDAVSGLYAARFSLEGSGGWREDASKLSYDPHHAMVGRDPGLPPQVGLHAYGAAGKYHSQRSRLRRPRSSLAFFVVKSVAHETHSLLIQTADTTWHAYNGWGGLTTYGSFSFPWRHAPNRSYMAEHELLSRAYKRSYNTPLVTRDYRAVNAPFGVEIAAIRFVERVGIDAHYCTGADLSVSARARDLLSRSKAYLSMGHDEYWSYAQREALEMARDDLGVHLNFWSGNEAYWAIRFEPSEFDDDDEPRTLVCYKETQSTVKLDPLDGAWTGTFRDARRLNPVGARPENALTGTMFVANAQRVDPLILDAGRFGSHRAWRNTLAADNDRVLVLLPGLLGHEWDEDVDNGFRPPGLQRLSESTFDHVQVIQDWGATFDTGRATHSLVLHFRSSGAIVFGAGCVQFAWALDDLHDANDPNRANKYSVRISRDPRGPEPIIQQLAINILADQGLSFPTLPMHLVQPTPSTDYTPPAVQLNSVECSPPWGIVTATGLSTDAGGNVAGIELSWHPPNDMPSRWHPAYLDRVAPHTNWTFLWGQERWQRLHAPRPPAGKSVVSLRVVDDSGNIATYRTNTVFRCPPFPEGYAIPQDLSSDRDEL